MAKFTEHIIKLHDKRNRLRRLQEGLRISTSACMGAQPIKTKA
ncbi:MAG: hypothetical protein WAT63_16965 [Rhodoferax sp.]|jgi:hypothetical protein